MVNEKKEVVVEEKKEPVTYGYVSWWVIVLTTNRKAANDKDVGFEFDEIIEMNDEQYNRILRWEKDMKKILS